MRLSDIRGQERAVSLLRSAVLLQRVHHAWLFSGMEGVGKETTARALAASLLCPEPVEGDACGACLSCEKATRGVHPDLIVVLPEASAVERGLLAKEDLARAPSRELKIEQIRRLEGILALSPVESKRRVVLLLEADSMNVPAQNAFLKTLEEPPAGTHLVLVARAGDALLPTIRSRCLRVPFAPLPDAVVLAALEERGIDPANARLMAAIAGGSLGAALSLTEEGLRGREAVLQGLESLDSEDFRPLLALAERLAGGGREAAEAALDSIALFYRDVALVAEGISEDRLANPDLLPLLQRAAARGPVDALRRNRGVEEARQAIRRHVAPRLAIERFLLGCVLPEAA